MSYARNKEDQLIKRIFAILFLVLIATPVFAKDSIVDWIKGHPDIVWNAKPTDYPEKVSSKDSIVWVGPIEEVATYINDQKETVIEFFCRHLSLVRPGPEGVIEPIQTKDSHSGYFVITLRSPSLTLEQGQEFKEEVRKVRHFAIVLGEPEDRRDFSGRTAVYVHSEKAEMSDKLQIQIIQ